MIEDVKAFYLKYRQEPLPTSPIIPNVQERDLAARIVKEESRELVDAMEWGDIVEVADGVADLIWVAIWAGLVHGIPIEPIWEEVRRTNMNKLPPDKPGGKIRKPEGWTPPDIKGILDAAK